MGSEPQDFEQLTEQFFRRGWCRFAHDPGIESWVRQALPDARASLTSPEQRQWHRCGGTWFAGVNALANRADGGVNGSGPLSGSVVDFINQKLALPDFGWDQAQVSVCYPGYPKPMEGESGGAFRYRRERDAAHVDGLLPEGSARRRYLREHHGFILGLPMVSFGEQAAPFVVFEGSHEQVRSALSSRFDGLAPECWGEQDITEVYHRVRRDIFESCARTEIFARPGEAYLVHRLTLHGIAPWGQSATAGDDGRMICYFRPDIGDPEAWLQLP